MLKTVYIVLRSVNIGVFDKRPPSVTKYPFIEYDLNEPYTNNNPLIYSLYIDIWDKGKSYGRVEDLAKSINNNMNDKTIETEHFYMRFKKESEYRLKDSDTEIKRKHIIYKARVFKKK